MATYVIGDVHGQLVKLLTLLEEAKLIDATHRWSGGAAQVWFMGDFFDRGPQGVGVVDLIMRLQTQAADAGGAIHSLLGNHEVLMLCVHRFPKAKKITTLWHRNGGQDTDLALVTSRQAAWLRSLPALALLGDRLLMHADAMFYLDYGSSIAEVNETISAMLSSNKVEMWDQLLNGFGERMAFASLQVNGMANVTECLEVFGGTQIIHGHTPIQYIADTIAPTAPFTYANRLAIDVDGGMYLGAPGFIYQLPD